MNLRTMAFAAIGLVAFGTSAVSFAQTAPGPQGTPPPPPIPVTGPTAGPLISPGPATTPSPLASDAAIPTTAPAGPAPVGSALPADASASPSPRGKRGHRNAASDAAPAPSPSPTDTPEPPQFSTLDGVWEIAFQPLTGARTTYSHLYVTQNGNNLTGTWRKDGKIVLPFTGTFDGRLLKLTVTDAGTTFTFSGYEENYMDMVGLYSDGDPKHQGIPFTGAHRKRERDRDVKVK